MNGRNLKWGIILLNVLCFLGFVAQGIISLLELKDISKIAHKKHFDYTFRHFLLLIMAATPMLLFALLFIQYLIDTFCNHQNGNANTVDQSSEPNSVLRRKIIQNTLRASSQLATCLLSIFLFAFAFMLIIELESRTMETPTSECDVIRKVDLSDDCVTSRQYTLELVAGIVCVVASLLFAFIQLHRLYAGKAEFLTTMNPRYPDVDDQIQHKRRLSVASE